MALLAPVFGGLGCELALRWLLFSPGALAASLGAPFRDAGLYVPSEGDEDYQKLRGTIGPFLKINTSVPHPELGWVSPRIDPETLTLASEGELAGRRPVLLFGSSYTSCRHDQASCYQGLFADSEFAREFALLNYGVSGYGPDQTLLLAAHVVERLRALDPIVVFSLVDDIEPMRTRLAVFQTPKPRFIRQGSTWELQLPDTLDLAEYVRRHPPDVRSYAWNYLRYGTGLLGREEGRRKVRRDHANEQAIVAHCFERWVQHMRALGVAHFALLFHSQRTYEREERALDLEQRRIQAELSRLGVPWVDSREEVSEHLARTGGDAAELFEEKHPSERCTALLFAALMRGLGPLLREER